jgi:2-(1,2-epoxy-1,2-dihydrophenyl)acetyl-CoA isomerase
MRRTMNITRIIHEMNRPVVAAVEGAAAGAGLSIALACDFRVVGESAKITTAFAKIAVSGDYGGIYYLTKMVGSARARELMLHSPVLSGREAYALGLMSRVVPDAEVGAAAREMATALARGPTVALGYLKTNINNAEDASLEAYLDAEATYQCRCLQTADYQEATSAFVQKRTPIFVGR